MNLLDKIVRKLQYQLLMNNHLEQKTKAEAYAEGIRNINEELRTNYKIEELYSLRFENLSEVINFYGNLPLKRE